MSDVSDWWQTAIIDMEPGVINIRGNPILDLIGTVSFPAMIWLMTRGGLPDEGQAHLLETALVAAVDHGPQAPSIATARMAVTCGLSLVDEAAGTGTCSGEFAAIGRAIEVHLAAEKGKPVPMNIDGATAVIYAELGFEPPMARGLFCLSRSVGAVAHAWEQMQQGGRNKGPTPPQYRWTYTGEE